MENRTIYVGFRARPETHETIRAEAERRGLSIAAYTKNAIEFARQKGFVGVLP